MPDEDSLSTNARRTAWNKGKLIGAKPPLRPNQVWSIRTRLLIERRARDLALFNLAIDSKLRGCDVVALRVENVAPNGYAVDRATVRQKKTGRPVKFELTDQTLHNLSGRAARGPRLFAALLNIISPSPTNRYWGIAGAQFKTPPAMYFEPAAFFMARSPTRPFEASASA